jgi:hypothetical protein
MPDDLYVDRLGKPGQAEQDLDRRLADELVEIHSCQFAEFRSRGFVFSIAHVWSDVGALATPRRAAAISMSQVRIELRPFAGECMQVGAGSSACSTS